MNCFCSIQILVSQPQRVIAWPFSIAGVWATQNWSWHTLTDNLHASHDKISSKQSPVMKIKKLWLGASGTDQVFYCTQNSNQLDFYTPLPPNILSPHPNPFPQHLQWWKWSLRWHKKNVKCQTETRSTTNPIQCNKTTCFSHCAIWEWRQQNNSHYYLHSTPPQKKNWPQLLCIHYILSAAVAQSMWVENKDIQQQWR